MRPNKRIRFLYTHKIFSAIAILLLIVFVLPFIIWYALPTQPLALFVIDKTADANVREHASIYWLMKHWKYVDPSSGNFYDAAKDYYGFFPKDSSTSPLSALQLRDVDLLYLADTYGIYRYPMRYDRYERLLPQNYIPIELTYGGLSAEEMDRIEEYARRGGTAVAEFNTLQDPQLRDRATQRRLERIFGVRYTGSLGRYYDNLNTAALWMKDQFARQRGKEWDLSGPGVIIIRQNEQDSSAFIVVLEADDLERNPVVVRNGVHPLVRNASDEIPYYYFFEILGVDTAASVISRFEIRCTGSGREKMAAAGIPLSFPAIVLSGAEEQRVYFAGDFADNAVDMMLTQYWNVEFLLSKLFSFYFVSDQTRFFWKFYLPLVDELFRQAAERSRIAGRR